MQSSFIPRLVALGMARRVARTSPTVALSGGSFLVQAWRRFAWWPRHTATCMDYPSRTATLGLVFE